MPQPTKTKPTSTLSKIVVNALEDLKGTQITVLDVQKLTTITDTMIICTGTSNRHVKSLAQNAAEDAKKAGFRPLGMEGADTGEWVLVDLGGVVVHVMQAQARAFYQLEKLWTVEEEVPQLMPRPKTAKKATKKSAGKAAPAKKAGKTATRKGPGGKPAPAKKPVARKAAAKKPVAKKPVAKKPAAKSAAKKAPARKPAKKSR